LVQGLNWRATRLPQPGDVIGTERNDDDGTTDKRGLARAFADQVRLSWYVIEELMTMLGPPAILSSNRQAG